MRQPFSDRSDTEQALLATQARHSAVLDAAFDAIVTMDHAGRIVDFNDAAERTFGYGRADAVGRKVSELLVPPRLREAHELGLRRHLDTGEPTVLGRPVRLSALRADGSEFDAELTINRIELPEGPLFTASIRDISEQIAAEELLRTAEQRYRTLVEQLPLVVYIDEADADCTNLYTSPQTQSMLGYSPLEWQDARFLERSLHPDDLERVVEEMAVEASENGKVSSEYRIVTPDGRVVWVRDESSAISDADGRPVLRQGYILDITAEREARDELERLAFTDPLTGLWNRTRLERVLAERGDDSEPTLLYLDLDDFKTVNDSLGHTAGDELLRTIAGRLREIVRPTDVVARIGGDEFALLVEGGNATTIAERIVAALREPIAAAGHALVVGASIGIATSGAAEILRHADMAMYDAKNAGGGTFRFFDPAMHEAVMSRLALLGDLARPSFLDELFVLYQPIFDMTSSRLSGVEALCRWRHPRGELIPPLEFLGLAEENGRILDIGLRVLQIACAQGAAWSAQFGSQLSISVNVAARQLADPGFADDVAAAVTRTRLDPRLLVLELTETALMHADDVSNRNLERLQQLGAHIAIDDFGTGYSSLAYLARLPIDILKIDRSFVEHCDQRDGGLRLVETIIALGHGLDLSVVAEGVERETQLAQLRAIECDGVQGFLLGRPGPPDAIEQLLALRAVDPRPTRLYPARRQAI
ncbi:MAG TPA: EAL domain-containing protein [Gaiellaceae bacterium]|nr:EAL domain-containing protein [Gaiellaceae bacterium]